MSTSTSNPITLSGASWSVCFWYEKYIFLVSETNSCIFHISTALDTTTSEITMCFDSNGSLYSSIGGNKIQTLCSTNCCDNTWRHVAIIYNSSTFQYSFYFNGIKCCNSVTGSSIGSNVSRPYFFIGRNISSTSTIYMTASIDDFRIYDNVLLTKTDIAQICGNCHLYSYQTST